MKVNNRDGHLKLTSTDSHSEMEKRDLLISFTPCLLSPHDIAWAYFAIHGKGRLLLESSFKLLLVQL